MYSVINVHRTSTHSTPAPRVVCASVVISDANEASSTAKMTVNQTPSTAMDLDHVARQPGQGDPLFSAVG